jgi:hypothetical protein
MKMNLKIERRHLLPREITLDPTFQFRHMGNNKAHVRGLAQTLRSTGSLDPISVWAEQDDAGKATGRLVLLDGGHRLDAYSNAKGHREGIPVRVLHGGLEEAMVAAIQANSRESLPLTKQEKMDAAWRLVRLPGKRLTVRTVASAAGVAPRSVDIMRKRWAAMEAAGREASGHWWRDRQDDPPEMEGRPEMTDEERQAAVAKLAEDIKTAFKKMPWKDQQLAAEALMLAVGNHKLRTMAEYLFGADEFDTSSEYFSTEVQPQFDKASGADF